MGSMTDSRRDVSSIYDAEFFRQHRAYGLSDYGAIADALVKTFHFDSITDLGCGPGLVLGHLKKRHGKEVRGLEGSQHGLDAAEPELRNTIERVDITTWQPDGRTSDLVICTEVAEHLPAEHADKLVDTIVALVAPRGRISFTAATPGQGGHDHINEQPPDYWLEKFSRRGWRWNHERTDAYKQKLLEAGLRHCPWFWMNAMIFEQRELLLSKVAPLVSVVIPCFRQARFLAEAVGSVREQTYPKDRIEIVVAAGDEEGEEKAKALGCVVIRDGGMGLSHARNMAIGAAKGEWIVPLDADDKLVPTFLEQTVREALTFCVGERAGAEVVVATHLREFGTHNGWFHVDRHKIKMGYMPQSCLYRKSLWGKAGGYDVATPIEDYGFWLDCMDKGGATMLYVPEELELRRRHEGQHTSVDPYAVFLATTKFLRPHRFEIGMEECKILRTAVLREWIGKRRQWFPGHERLKMLARVAEAEEEWT
jgi:SAM-dependent methyltransferase